MFSTQIINILKINPMFYIVEGYRDALLYANSIADQGWYSIYFWIATSTLLWAGNSLLKKLQGQFSDLL